MLDFISYLFIAFGILQIILFFKIWGMTDDVKKIKNKEATNLDDAKSCFINNNIDGARKYLDKEFEVLKKRIGDIRNWSASGTEEKLKALKAEYNFYEIPIPTELEELTK